MTQTMNRPSVAQFMKQAEEKAANPTSNFKPTFVLLKENQKAIIRPLFNLVGADIDQCVMAMHSKYNATDPKQSINSVCAQEVGKICELCRLADAGDKELRPSWSIMMPVYLHKIGLYVGTDENGNAVWQDVTWKKADGTEEKVNGLRILELKDFGKVYEILKFLRSHHRDEKEHDITICDFTIEQSGVGKKKSFVTKARAPKRDKVTNEIIAMPPSLRQIIPTPDAVRQMVIDACKPRIVVTGNPAIDGVVQAVKNAQIEEEEQY